MIVAIIAAVSVDGKIAETPDQLSLDWTSKEDTKFFVQKTKELGVVVMGRKTFDTIGKPLKDRRTIVMTRQVNKPDLAGVEYTNESPLELVNRLKEEQVSSMAIAGGGSIYSQFLADGLVTDVFLTVEPIFFGGGVPLAQGFDRIDMTLVDVDNLGENTVLLHYRI